MARGNRQLNIRLTDEQYEVLETAAWAKRRSKLELGSEAVAALIRRLAKDPTVKEALALRARFEEEETNEGNKVRPLDSARRPPRKKR